MIGTAFAKALSDGRAGFNQRVLDAQRRYPGFDTAAFSAFVQAAMDDMVDAVDAIDSARVTALTQAAFELALELTGQGLVGPHARSDMVTLAWSALAPQLGQLLARQPAEVLGLITNAVLHLERMGTARPRQWLDDMALLGPQVHTLAHLRALGQLLAWRAGAAHFRVGALMASESTSLPDAVALAAFGCDSGQSWPALRERMLADPWFSPHQQNHAPLSAPLREVRIGAFIGFGGEFAAPPEVRVLDDGFAVRSAQRHFLIVADQYGAVLHGSTEAEFELAAAPEPSSGLPANVQRSGPLLTINGRQLTLDVPPDSVAMVGNAHTLALTSPFTHVIRLVALQ